MKCFSIWLAFTLITIRAFSQDNPAIKSVFSYSSNADFHFVSYLKEGQKRLIVNQEKGVLEAILNIYDSTSWLCMSISYHSTKGITYTIYESSFKDHLEVSRYSAQGKKRIDFPTFSKDNFDEKAIEDSLLFAMSEYSLFENGKYLTYLVTMNQETKPIKEIFINDVGEIVLTVTRLYNSFGKDSITTSKFTESSQIITYDYEGEFLKEMHQYVDGKLQEQKIYSYNDRNALEIIISKRDEKDYFKIVNAYKNDKLALSCQYLQGKLVTREKYKYSKYGFVTKYSKYQSSSKLVTKYNYAFY